MKLTLLILVILLFQAMSHGTYANNDQRSLDETKLATATIDQSPWAKEFDLACSSFRNAEFEDSSKQFQQAAFLAKESQDKKNEALCIMWQGNCALAIGNFEAAGEYYSKSSLIMNSFGKEHPSVATALDYLTSNTYGSEDDLLVLEFKEPLLQRALAIRELSKNFDCAKSLYLIGLSYRKANRGAEAIAFLRSALQILNSAENLHDGQRAREKRTLCELPNIIEVLDEIYYSCDSNETAAMAVLKEMLVVARKENNLSEQARQHFRIGVRYQNSGNTNEAELELTKAAQLAEKIDPDDSSYGYIGYLVGFFAEKNLWNQYREEIAFKYLNIMEQRPGFSLEKYKDYCQVLLPLAQEVRRQGRNSEAEKLFLKCSRRAEAYGCFDISLECLKELRKIYLASNNSAALSTLPSRFARAEKGKAEHEEYVRRLDADHGRLGLLEPSALETNKKNEQRQKSAELAKNRLRLKIVQRKLNGELKHLFGK